MNSAKANKDNTDKENKDENSKKENDTQNDKDKTAKKIVQTRVQTAQMLPAN